MIYSNKRYVAKLKNSFLIIGILILAVITTLVFLEKFIMVAILAAVFLLSILIIALLNYQYFRATDENNRFAIRYYSIFSVNRKYESIDFPVSSLRKIELRKYFFGLKYDLIITVRLKQGLADYPPVCLSAMTGSERKRLITWINNLKRNVQN